MRIDKPMWDNGNRYTNRDIGWLSALGYDGYLINPQITTDKTDFPYLDKDGKPILDKDGNPSIRKLQILSKHSW